MKRRWRIGVAIQTQHPHAEDQQLYLGVRQYAREHPKLVCLLAPFAAHDLKTCRGSRPPYDAVLAQATPELVEVATRVHVPVLDVWRDSPVTVPINCVFPDFAKAGRLVADYLIALGFEHFGFVVNRRVQSQCAMCDDRLIGGNEPGFAAWVKSRGFRCAAFLAPRDVVVNAATWSRWSQAIRAWIAARPKPLGLFVPNDLLCRHIADIAPDLGLKIPHDLALVSADNEPNLCLLSSPSLTSIDLGYRRVGYEAAAFLHRLLEEGFRQRERQILWVDALTLYPRESTDATAVRDPLVGKAMRFIRDTVRQPLRVTTVAKFVGVGRRTLERRFRTVLGRSVMSEITRCRLERLKQMLVETDVPIKALAAETGFSSPRALSQTFVREEGLSPHAYRARRRPSSSAGISVSPDGNPRTPE